MEVLQSHHILIREREMATDSESWVFPNPASKSGHIDSMKKAFCRCVIRAKLDPSRISARCFCSYCSLL